MIKIHKLEEPNILKTNKVKWTAMYLSLLDSHQEVPESLKKKYRDKEIKDQLILETNGKCAYCESKIGHICYGDVEHILPKSKGKRPDLFLEWTNLTYACEACNRTGKRDYFSLTLPLINPYVDNPEDHLMAVGPFISHKPGDKKGEVTEKILELNRPNLFERRLERMKSMISLTDKWAVESNPQLKEIIRKELIKESEVDTEYSFVIKSYLNQLGI